MSNSPFDSTNPCEGTANFQGDSTSNNGGMREAATGADRDVDLAAPSAEESAPGATTQAPVLVSAPSSIIDRQTDLIAPAATPPPADLIASSDPHIDRSARTQGGIESSSPSLPQHTPALVPTEHPRTLLQHGIHKEKTLH